MLCSPYTCLLLFWYVIKGLRHSIHLKDYNLEPLATRQQFTKDITVLQRTHLLILKSLRGSRSCTHMASPVRSVLAPREPLHRYRPSYSDSFIAPEVKEACVFHGRTMFQIFFEWLLLNLRNLKLMLFHCRFLFPTFKLPSSSHPTTPPELLGLQICLCNLLLAAAKTNTEMFLNILWS